MAALTPTLAAIPAGSTVILRQKYEPTWDSCDGQRDTYGWDPVTVNLSWRYAGHPAATEAHVRSVLARLGWTETDHAADGDPLTWRRTVATGVRADAILQGGPGWDPTDWSLSATAPPATHPVQGC